MEDAHVLFDAADQFVDLVAVFFDEVVLLLGDSFECFVVYFGVAADSGRAEVGWVVFAVAVFDLHSVVLGFWWLGYDGHLGHILGHCLSV